MVNYDSVREMLNVTENMQHLVNNVGHDDDTMTFEGVDWFQSICSSAVGMRRCGTFTGRKPRSLAVTVS